MTQPTPGYGGVGVLIGGYDSGGWIYEPPAANSNTFGWTRRSKSP